MQYPLPYPLLLPLLIWLAAGPKYIAYLKQKAYGQFIREDGPQGHHSKAGTPTMGGLLILASVFLAFSVFCVFQPTLLNPETIVVLLSTLALGWLGFQDDWGKITKQHNKGLGGYTKLAIQGSVGLGIGLSLMFGQHHTQLVLTPNLSIDLGWAYPVFCMFTVQALSNAYNLTDGLDGLAASCGLMSFAALAFITIGAFPSLSLLSLLFLGGCLGFLFFNKFPAKVFMGDTGSLALGGAMAAIALMSHQEIYLILIGLIYAIEALSVILQVASFKLTGKRIFKMSPIHHHYELSGWSEPKIVINFALVQLSAAILAVLLQNLATPTL